MKPPILVTPASLASRLVGMKEIAGAVHNPMVNLGSYFALISN